MADARNEPVSISDVAKRLRESARDDRLDFRPEVAELLLNTNRISRPHPEKMGTAEFACASRVDLTRVSLRSSERR
jgi:hypothetical protein